ncbi:MAG: PRC-barrel domain-containing protein [Thermoplasmata archaeon]|nr:PRC-barrel domain-containing protein [Thermoplasmata archaeon]
MNAIRINRFIGKPIMSTDGILVGVIDNVVVDTRTGKLEYVLAKVSDQVDPKDYKTDPTGRLVLPFSGIQSVKNVVVMKMPEPEESLE